MSKNNVKVNKTNEEANSNLAKNKEIADKYAKIKGVDSIEEITGKARDMMNSDDSTIRQLGKRLAVETISDLAQLILYQEIESLSLPSEYDIVEKTNDGYITEGNAKEYIASLLTGNTVYNPTNFNPDKQTLKQLNKYIIQMYDAGGALNKNAFQFLKQLTLPEGQWIPYFKSGKLSSYMNILRNEIYKAFKVYLSNMLFNKITTTTYKKTINGNATNMFDCLVSEVIPNINKMTQLNSEYNIVESQVIDTANMDDIIVIMSNKNKTLIQNGIKTQLFNAELLGPSGKLLKPENIVCLGNKINLTDEDTVASDSGTEWVDDNTIYVIDISKIKTIYQVNSNASQFYARNITLYIALHVWGAMDILPWCKAFKYTNNNLSTLPN